MNDHEQLPGRIVVLGAAGFVGRATASSCETAGMPVLRLARGDLDLLSPGADVRLASLLRADDTLLFVSARAPCKTVAMFTDNIRMAQTVCDALTRAPVRHVVYISSDAVYADAPVPLTEASAVAPDTLHGMMHAARETMLRHALDATPLAVLRPTLIYGDGDPHNGYGPNRFRRLAAEGQEIMLFGDGEERRDHVLIDDVGEIVRRVVVRRSRGVLNVATGEVVSFRAAAEFVVKQFSQPVAIRTAPRQGPMPHGGYRPFDVAACRKSFPDFRYTNLADGVARVHRQGLAAA